MTLAFLYPGQGSQAIGMGKALYEAFSAARDVFAEVDEALQQSLSKIMFEGPAEDLQLTENAQPALMAASLAMQRCSRRAIFPSQERAFSLAIRLANIRHCARARR